MELKPTLSRAIFSAIAVSAAIAQAAQISITGSDTMLIINQAWAEAFQKSGGGGIAVQGGGSSIGIDALINGVTDVCAASRKIRKGEIDRARSRGVVVYETVVAMDGLAVIVNADNSVDHLTLDELRRIYIGQITNWKQVGGPNEAITVFSRDSNSGTYGFFQQVVLRNQNWGKSVRFMSSTNEELREVQRTAGSIAYGGVAYFKNKKNVKIVPIAPRAGAQALAPTEANVRSKAYPIWRYLYYYTNNKPSGNVKKYIDFVLSRRGQELVEQVGYYSLR